MKFSMLTLILVIAALQGVEAQQAVLTPIKDNTLYQTSDGSLSDGAGDYLFVGRVGSAGAGSIRRAVLKFDLSSNIPSQAVITAVSVTMNMSKTVSGSQSVSLRKLTADWGEGTSNASANEGSGAPSATNDATWIHRFYRTSNWTTPGGDFAPTASATATITDVGSYTWTSTSQLVADAQGWLVNPSSNFGWIVIGNEATIATAKRFDSRENPTIANRPRLTISYTTATAVSRSDATPTEARLSQNFPNPFNPTTTIMYSLTKESWVSLTVYDLLGREVRRIIDGIQMAGSHAVPFDATGLPSGIYVYRMNAESQTFVRTMTFLR